jgi:hypothetical protein
VTLPPMPIVRRACSTACGCKSRPGCSYRRCRDTIEEAETPTPVETFVPFARTIFPEFVASLRSPQLELTHGDDGQSFLPGGTFPQSYIHQSFLHRTQRHL